MNQHPIEMLTYITQTPVDDEITEVSLNFSMKRLSDATATESISKLNDEITNVQFAQDVPIWKTRSTPRPPDRHESRRAHPPVPSMVPAVLHG